MDRWISVVALVAMLLLLGRGFPARWLLAATAAALALVVVVLWIERSGLLPPGTGR